MTSIKSKLIAATAKNLFMGEIIIKLTSVGTRIETCFDNIEHSRKMFFVGKALEELGYKISEKELKEINDIFAKFENEEVDENGS